MSSIFPVYFHKFMKIIVTHTSPDMDAITSVWLIKKFLPNWQDAKVEFVPAGERIGYDVEKAKKLTDPIEIVGESEYINVDTGLGPLDHHQLSDDTVCGASRTLDYVKGNLSNMNKERLEALDRMIKVVVDIDHFKEVFWKDTTEDYHEFSLVSILDGLKLKNPNNDLYYLSFISEALDGVFHEFENRIWAEREIKEKGVEFETRFGRGIGFDSINDEVIKLSQKMGYVLVARKDARKGYLRIKARPNQNGEKKVDLTLAYEKFKKMDPDATWFLHVSKKMLLNGSVKNPKMRPTRLKLGDIIKVLETV